MSAALTLPVTGAALLALAAGIAAYQRWRAPRCPRHRPWAGRAAWLLAAACATAGMVLLSRGAT